MRIRVFVPYDVLTEYHDKTAILSQSVDRKTLRQHYEMCCIENMAAEMALTESGPVPAAESRSGIASPLELTP
ncbi:hypothetical protein EsDP_00007210 [Epichloe bromicola]|uniref:Uncharacterized protein n=1 Tax=Epichloe bromicola TaxID=79588 RepID=A0ABQ0CZW1_9HYPO